MSEGEYEQRSKKDENTPWDLHAECLLDIRAGLGEGAIWDDRAQRLYWVDIAGKRLHELDPETGHTRQWDLGQMPGTVVPCADRGLLLALHDGVARFDPQTGRLGHSVRPTDYDSTRYRFNDGKCDPQGRFWVGSMGLQQPRPPGTLYRFDADGLFHAMLSGVGTSNGIVWETSSGPMYYIDTPLQRVDAFDFHGPDGTITGRRVAIEVPADIGRPDGSTLDSEGMLWIAHWEGGRVTRWNPRTGKWLRTIRVPAKRVTSCAFGGKDMDRLYITTARAGLSDDALNRQPLAGGLFVAHPGVRGAPCNRFGGGSAAGPASECRSRGARPRKEQTS